MDSRRAGRLATKGLADAARLLASKTDRIEDLSPADQARLCRAYEKLAYELEARIGLVPRAPRVAPVDPGQEALFMIDREDCDEVLGEETG
jgi:hypothetical protein